MGPSPRGVLKRFTDSWPSDEGETVLVPIRYPLSPTSERTLEHAHRRTAGREGARIVVLHVNVRQNNDAIRTDQICRAVDTIIGDVRYDVVVRRGFLVEEEILAEAIARDVDAIVIGRNRSGRSRRALNALIGTKPPIASFLETNASAPVEFVDALPENS